MWNEQAQAHDIRETLSHNIINKHIKQKLNGQRALQPYL